MFSVVADGRDPRGVLVRARVRGDLEALAKFALPVSSGWPDIIATPERDYPYRIRIARAVFAAVAGRLAGDIDYTNFKSEVARVQGGERAHVYSEIWSVLYDAFRTHRSDAAAPAVVRKPPRRR